MQWGSSSKAGRVTLNEDLVVAPVDCIDYVIIHECCHLLVPNHGAEFQRVLSSVLPD